MPHKEKIPKKEFETTDRKMTLKERQRQIETLHGAVKSPVGSKSYDDAIKNALRASRELAKKESAKQTREASRDPEKLKTLRDRATKGSPPFSDKEINRGYRNIK
jgi:hypothetical protein